MVRKSLFSKMATTTWSGRTTAGAVGDGGALVPGTLVRGAAVSGAAGGAAGGPAGPPQAARSRQQQSGPRPRRRNNLVPMALLCPVRDPVQRLDGERVAVDAQTDDDPAGYQRDVRV